MPRRIVNRSQPFRSKHLPGNDPELPGMHQPGNSPGWHSANRLFRMGQYQEAKEGYLLQAERGMRAGFPHASRMYIQTSHCAFLLDEPEAGLELLQRHLTALIGAERWEELIHISERNTAWLKENDQDTAADDVRKWYQQHLPEEFKISGLLSGETVKSSSHAKLPGVCPACGVVLDPRDVEWVGNDCAICEYCGSVIQGEV